MQYGELIRRRRTALGLNQAELAAGIGVSRNTVAGWETNHSRPDLNTLPALCKALQISLNTFFGLGKKRSAEEAHVLEVFFALEERDRESILWQMEALRDRRAALREKERQAALPRTVTLFANELGAAAGFGAALGDAQGEKITLLADRETERADEVITVCGRSMEPTFMDGDRVLVQHTKELREGEIGIFLVDNEGYIKEYRKDGLHSHNPEFRTMTFHEDQNVRCIGRVIGKLREEQIPTREQMNRIAEAGTAGKEQP
ncbi:MAG: helix-turn-helix domain-containing protein [Clostridia bacterium]|nr:helix-turn-helix domain-containing protein [Clostridia bacterium]